MADSQIPNPSAAFTTVTDFRTGLDAGGFPLNWDSEPFEVRANVAVAVGDVVTWVVPTSAVPVSVTNAVATGGSGTFLGGWRVAGVVTKAAAAGAICQIVKEGFCRVNVGAGTPAIGDLAVCGATAGQADAIAAATGVAAGTFATNILGIFLGTKDASNLCSLWYNHM